MSSTPESNAENLRNASGPEWPGAEFAPGAAEGIALHDVSQPWAAWPTPRTVLGEPGVRMSRAPLSRTTARDGRDLHVLYKDPITGLEAIRHVRAFPGTTVSRRHVTVRNNSDRPVGLDILHAAFIDGIPWVGQGQFRLHIPCNHNYAEGQWRVHGLEELGLIRTGKKNVSHIIVNAVGRSSTASLPMAILEDVVNNWALVWQIEHPGAWLWDLGQGDGDVLSLAVGGLTEVHGHWFKNLQPGETLESLPVAVGWVRGGADEAIAEMTRYRRVACRSPHPVDDGLPVIFNDYNNCLMGNPTEAESLRLVPRAAAAGCEIYVVDAGWFGDDQWKDVGDWHENPRKFPNGLNHLMDAIRAAGMTPGLWLEIEAMTTHVELARMPDAWFLSRRGHRNLFSNRYALDFRNPEVRAFADETVDRLIRSYGLGYIKFDYNMSVQLGTDTHADSPGDGALEHMRAVLDWYRALRARHPSVILECCSSGGMRNDYGMLAIMQLASSSDQPDYRLLPAITIGCAGAILPEQLAVWSYPRRGEDREAAVFNMVNGMLARYHVSGPIADIDEPQFDVIREAIALYQAHLRADIPRSIPFFPLGRRPIEQANTFMAMGLRVEGENRAWLALWRLNADAPRVEVPLPPGAEASPALRVTQAFPAAPSREFEVTGGALGVTLPAPYTAVLFRLEWEVGGTPVTAATRPARLI